jgi:cytochrome c biogenesis protein CcmG/thiol:disulfide interchange protein DsbE
MKFLSLFFFILLGAVVNAQESPVKWATQEGFFGELEGKPLPDFHGLMVDGKYFDSKRLKNEIVVINFWFENCPPCIDEMPELNKLVAKYAGKNVRFIGITHDLPRKAKNFQKRIPYHYQIISLTTKEISKLNINHGFPSNILVGRDGKILFAMANFSLTDQEFKAKSTTFESKLHTEIKNFKR